MIALAAFTLAVLTASEPTAVSSSTTPASRAEALRTLPSSDEDIRRALFEMLERDPERVVCSVRNSTSSRQPRKTCGTLRTWFASREPLEIQEKRAPWQLVEEIKEQRRKSLLRGRNGS